MNCANCKHAKAKLRGNVAHFICTLYYKPALAKCLDYRKR